MFLLHIIGVCILQRIPNLAIARDKSNYSESLWLLASFSSLFLFYSYNKFVVWVSLSARHLVQS